MIKIITAINVMISNSKKVSKILTAKSGELFFLYDDKHKWSVAKREDVHYLHYYTGDETIEQLASEDDWELITFMTYSSKELKTREAYESMQELYSIIKEKSLGVEDALDDIINGGSSDISF